MPQPPDSIAVIPRDALDAVVQVPGSKSITNRVLLIAALAAGESELLGPLESDDTNVMRAALGTLGITITSHPDAWRITGAGGALPAHAEPLFVGNSGTTARFLTAAAALANGPITIDGDPRMRERPIGDLVGALRALSVPVEFLGRNDCPPLRIGGGGLAGGDVTIDASRSSQYVSALLLAAPYAQRDLKLGFTERGVVSRPYIDLTLLVMRAFGADADWCDEGEGLRVRAGRPYRGRRFAIEPDASAAAYPFCAAAITGGCVRIENIAKASIQADFALLGVLEQMGCRVERGDDFVEVRGPSGALAAVDVDLNDFPDAALALAVTALFASGETRIRNVANLRIKETDRLAALEAELRKLGAEAHAGPDSLTIRPGPLRGAEIETYDDHRMAMAFALAGLRIPGVTIRDPACVSKTWPGYFSALESW